MYRDTDGYIIIDLKGIDVSRASQSVPGLYEKVAPVLDANKLVIVNNAGNHTPLPGSCIKASNYIRITTDIYIFTINSNNILIIEANGSSITVDVSIIPAYSEGTKIADFEINGQSGELYIPAYPDIINDSVASDHTVYSSDKVNTLLSGKADTSAIPTKTSQLDNDSGYITSSDIPAIPDDLNDLSDVDISSASDAQVLTYDAISGKWVNATSPTGVTALSQLSDVNIASASDGEVLTYDSTSGKWVNADVPTYTAGANISISNENVISATDTTYSEGTGIDITSNTVSLDINGLTSASTLDGTEEIAIYDGTGEKKTTAAAVAALANSTTVESASWTANSSNQFGVALTGSISVTQGLYLVLASMPVMTQSTFTVYVDGTNITKYGSQFISLRGQTTACLLIKVNNASDSIDIKSGESNANTYSYIERGGLYAYKLA